MYTLAMKGLENASESYQTSCHKTRAPGAYPPMEYHAAGKKSKAVFYGLIWGSSQDLLLMEGKKCTEQVLLQFVEGEAWGLICVLKSVSVQKRLGTVGALEGEDVRVEGNPLCQRLPCSTIYIFATYRWYFYETFSEKHFFSL